MNNSVHVKLVNYKCNNEMENTIPNYFDTINHNKIYARDIRYRCLNNQLQRQTTFTG